MIMLATTNSDNTLITSEKEYEFKRPLHPAPRKKVLDEEAYVKKLDDIIERDFFPDLDNLKDKLQYIEASDTNDILKLTELYAKYSEGSTPIANPAESPATFDTPVANPSESPSKTPPRNSHDANPSNETCNKEEKPTMDDDLKHLSLDKFMASYTSEDNESFELVMEEQEKKWKLKHAWLFEAEEKHNLFHTPNLALPTIEEQKQSKILALTGTSDKERDTRPLTVENWNYKTFNPVMFVPEESPLSSSQKIELARQKEREVCHDNTRFRENPFNESLSQATMLEASAIQAYKKEGKVGVDGKELRESPKVNGYSFIRSPSPAPGVDCSPLMTWGQVDGTPFQLDGSQTPLIKGKNSQGPSYKIPKVSARDELLLKLSEKVNQNHRDRKSRALSAARSTFSSPVCKGTQSSRLERLTSMSPAAQKLFSSKIGVHRGTDRALRASYTPSPLSRSSTPKSTLTTSRLSLNTPKSLTRPLTPTMDTQGLTDNLLNLPKRQNNSSQRARTFKRKCAADFF